VWESTAIFEYLSELAGGRGWPRDPGARAIARAVTAEMHAGFGPLRNAYPMNIRARGRRVPMTAELAASIARLDAVWTDCRQRFGAAGPWLFGDYSAADAMYLPVAFRFQTYGAAGLGEVARAYAAHAVNDPLAAPWAGAAASEPETIEHDETGR
jgi:glutathione S-transferase